MIKGDMYRTEVNNSVSNNIAERIENERSWAELPDLLLYMIFKQIVVDTDRVNISLVCKSWNSILQSPILPKQQFQLNTVDCTSPHLFFTNNKLIHPTLGKVHELNIYPERILGVQLRTGKEDWLLFTQNWCAEYGTWYYGPLKAFLYNPFTLAMVWLPTPLDDPKSMCFTSSPTSTDFKVVAVRSGYDYERGLDKIAIDTIKYGEERWTTCEFVFKEESIFQFSYCVPVLYKGMCFILGETSTLLIHDPKKKTFFLHKAPEFLPCDVQEQYMLECDGKLLVVFVETSGSWVIVCRWNVSLRKWEKLESLGNKVLFVSRPYSLSETVNVSELSNRIYFPRLVGDHCLFYSLSTKSFYTSDGLSFTTFHGSKSAVFSTWIKPSCAYK